MNIINVYFSNIKYFAIMQKYIEINKFYNIYQIK